MEQSPTNDGMSVNSPLRVAFETLGCRSNYADTVDLQAAVVERGGIPCSFEQEADVYVLNTCTVTHGADKTAYQLIRRINNIAPKSRVVVTGCLAEIGKKDIEAVGTVDAVIGPGKRGEVIEAIFRSAKPTQSSLSINDPMSFRVPGPGKPLGETFLRSRYHLRIQEGCENSCTFCIIPTTRGLFRSRNPENILNDLKHLGDVGYQEVVLSGTHIGGYGEDCQSSLLKLLQILAQQSPVKRIRLSSIDPNDLNSDIIDVLSQSNIFCEHLHICVQAFSNRTLKRMNRRYRLRELYSLVECITKKTSNFCLGSDLIVGFPGESRDEVEQGMKIFLELPFSYLHVFPYSERQGTAATRLEGSVPIPERKRRVARWRALSERRKRAYLEQLIGKSLEVIVEEINVEEKIALGTSREYAPVKIAFREEMMERSNISGLSRGGKLHVCAKKYDLLEGKLLCA